MHFSVNQRWRLVDVLFWIKHRGEKRYKYRLSKELKLTGRGSAMSSWTPTVVHIHKNINTQNIHSIFIFRLKTSQRERKLHLTTETWFLSTSFSLLALWVENKNTKVQFLLQSCHLQRVFNDASIRRQVWAHWRTSILCFHGPVLLLMMMMMVVDVPERKRRRSRS